MRSSGFDGSRPARLAVMLSGSGRTLLNLQESIDQGRLDATVALVIGSRECLGVTRADTDLGVPTLVMPGVIEASTLESTLRDYAVDLVVLAGYLQLVRVPSSYRGRVVNIHPALLPAFGGQGMYGDRVHQAVLASGASESGCTVHLCDEVYDRGPIVLQRRCPVLSEDTVRSLADRVFVQECVAYPEAISMLLERGFEESA